MNSIEFFAGMIAGGVLGSALAFIFCIMVVTYARNHRDDNFYEDDLKD